jgi:adducin
MGVGAASKGIIQRDFQHHATVFKSPYAKNPFDSISNEELEEYRKVIDKKNKGESDVASPVGDDTFAEDTTDPGDVTSPVTGDDTARSPLSPTTDTEHDGLGTVSLSVEQGVAPQAATPSKECISGDHYNGEETDGNRTFSEGEGDTSRATDPESAASPKKEKKKKSGLRTPSFLKKKKKDKKKEKVAA